jgi:gliding motility-associated-like protein
MNNIAIGDTLSLGPIYQSTTIFAENITDFGCHNLSGLYQFNMLVHDLPDLMLSSDKYNNTAYLGQIITIFAEPSNYESYSFYLNGQLVQSSSSNIYLSNKFYDGDVISAYAFNGTCLSPLDTLRLTILPIPNAFTPDGDGINDIFAKGLNIQIFNRWGQLLYEGDDGWDGTYNGDLVQAGTYYYIIKLPQIEEEDKVINGVVTVVR